MNELQDQVAIVTGAARGIGRAIALKLADEGAKLALVDVKAEWLEESLALVRAKGVEAEGFACDIASGEAVEAAVKAVHGRFGKIDILVNNAGITRDTLLVRMSEADWDAVLSVNLKGAFLMTKAVGRIMMKQRGGAIVNMASVVGLMGNAGQANYTASKAGLIALTKTTARELGPRGVRANAIAPGFVHTAMTDALPEAVREGMLKIIPLGRAAEPEEIADAAVFLAGPRARYITGQVLAVCGGMTMY
ncbi:MAG: 3-oxoacyl-[Kiritimatiellae bacterium]|nr:3-oxoacyl-[acyl-carrier-protein] reductase [Kiritimatiellia bacterium]